MAALLSTGLGDHSEQLLDAAASSNCIWLLPCRMIRLARKRQAPAERAFLASRSACQPAAPAAPDSQSASAPGSHSGSNSMTSPSHQRAAHDAALSQAGSIITPVPAIDSRKEAAHALAAAQAGTEHADHRNSTAAAEESPPPLDSPSSGRHSISTEGARQLSQSMAKDWVAGRLSLEYPPAEDALNLSGQDFKSKASDSSAAETGYQTGAAVSSLRGLQGTPSAEVLQAVMATLQQVQFLLPTLPICAPRKPKSSLHSRKGPSGVLSSSIETVK